MHAIIKGCGHAEQLVLVHNDDDGVDDDGEEDDVDCCGGRRCLNLRNFEHAIQNKIEIIKIETLKIIFRSSCYHVVNLSNQENTNNKT